MQYDVDVIVERLHALLRDLAATLRHKVLPDQNVHAHSFACFALQQVIETPLGGEGVTLRALQVHLARKEPVSDHDGVARRHHRVRRSGEVRSAAQEDPHPLREKKRKRQRGVSEEKNKGFNEHTHMSQTRNDTTQIRTHRVLVRRKGRAEGVRDVVHLAAPDIGGALRLRPVAEEDRVFLNSFRDRVH